MRSYWKEDGCLVLCADNDDESDDMEQWFSDYQNNPEMLEIDTSDRPKRGRIMNSMHDDDRDYRQSRSRSQGRTRQSQRGYSDGYRRRNGDGSTRRNGDE